MVTPIAIVASGDCDWKTTKNAIVTISMATIPLFNGDTLLENAIQRFKPDGSIVAWVLEPR